MSLCNSASFVTWVAIFFVTETVSVFIYVWFEKLRFRFFLGNLFLFDLRPNDTGTYVCEADNGVEFPVSTISTLDVLGTYFDVRRKFMLKGGMLKLNLGLTFVLQKLQKYTNGLQSTKFERGKRLLWSVLLKGTWNMPSAGSTMVLRLTTPIIPYYEVLRVKLISWFF